MIRATEKDFEKIYNILSDESIYPYTTDDYSENELISVLTHNLLKSNSIVLMPNKYSVFIFMPLLANSYSMHMNILPRGRRKIGISAGKESMQWMFKNTKCNNIVCFIPSFNRRAIVYASLIGMIKTGEIPNSFKKNGHFHDQIIMYKGEV